MENDILYIIREQMPGMSKGHRRIAQYVLDHYDDAAFETAATIGKLVGASESTVVRFATALGYDGYPEYQKALVVALRNRLASVKKLDEQYGDNTQGELIRQVMSRDIDNLQKTVESVDVHTFEAVVKELSDAENVYIVGLRGGSIPAQVLFGVLRIARQNVWLVDQDVEDEIVEQLFRIGEKDCLICISVPKYSERSIFAFELATDRKAKTVLLTDDERSPMNMYAGHVLYAKTERMSVLDSLVAPMSLVNAIAVAVSVGKQDAVTDNMGIINACLMGE